MPASSEPLHLSKFARRLRELRLTLGLTQKAFAAKIGFTQSGVARWELDKQVPNYTHSLALAELAGEDVTHWLPAMTADEASSQDKRLFGEQAIASHLGVSIETLQQIVATSDLPIFRVGAVLTARVSTLEAHLCKLEAAFLSSIHDEPVVGVSGGAEITAANITIRDEGAVPYVGVPGIFIHPDGRVFSSNSGKMREIQAHVDRSYLTVQLWNRDTKRYSRKKVHRMVGETFLGPPPSPKHKVFFRSENREDCSVGNLEWRRPRDFKTNGRQL